MTDELYKKVKGLSLTGLEKVYSPSAKEHGEGTLDILSKEIIEKLKIEDETLEEIDIKNALVKVEKELIRKIILEKKLIKLLEYRLYIVMEVIPFFLDALEYMTMIW